MKTIVINADDFGRSIGRNEAIDYAFKNGLIGSASLIVNTKNARKILHIKHL